MTVGLANCADNVNIMKAVVARQCISSDSERDDNNAYGPRDCSLDQERELEISSSSSIQYKTNLMSEVISNRVLDEAYNHVYKSRKDNSANSDIWKLSLDCPKVKEEVKEEIRAKLLSGEYRLSAVGIYVDKEGESYSRWSSIDAIVLKEISTLIDWQVHKDGENQSICKFSTRIGPQMT